MKKKELTVSEAIFRVVYWVSIPLTLGATWFTKNMITTAFKDALENTK